MRPLPVSPEEEWHSSLKIVEQRLQQQLVEPAHLILIINLPRRKINFVRHARRVCRFKHL